MFAQRLDRLETDLQLLITMHDLFLESDTESVIDGNSGKGLSHYQFDEVPERDITNRNISKEKTSRQTFDSLKDEVSKPSVAIKAPFPSDKNHKPVSKSAPKDSENSQESPMAPNVNISHKTTMANDMESERIQDLEKEIRSLKEDILKEKVLRVEVEESAKHVYIQLQKVEIYDTYLIKVFDESDLKGYFEN